MANKNRKVVWTPDELLHADLRVYRKGGYDKWRKEVARLWRAWLAELKLKRGCKDCGYNENADALEFDHIQPKRAAIGSLIGGSVKRLLEELARCEVVCSRCHSLRTAQRRAQGKNSSTRQI